MERKILKQLDLPEYTQPLNSVIEFLNNLTYSAVKTKYNAKGNWDAVSIRGYSDDISNILKPGVLKSDVKPAELRWTKLYEEPFLLPLKEILSHIPAEFERVRIMRLKAGTDIKKHTDKVDKEIKAGKITSGTIVCTLTGHGLKDPDTAIAQCNSKMLNINANLGEVKAAILDNM